MEEIWKKYRTMEWALLLASLVFANGCAERAEEPAELLLINARIVIGYGSVVCRGSILIRQGTIEAITEGDASYPFPIYGG